MSNNLFDLTGKGGKKSGQEDLFSNTPQHYKKADFDFTSHSQPLMRQDGAGPSTLSQSQPMLSHSHDPLEMSTLHMKAPPSLPLQQQQQQQKQQRETADMVAYYKRKLATTTNPTSGGGDGYKGSADIYHRPVDRDYGYRPTNNYVPPDYNYRAGRVDHARESELNMTIAHLTERLKKSEAENEEKNKTIADLEEKAKRASLRHHELVALYKKANEDQYQDYLRMQNKYNETMHQFIREPTMTVADKSENQAEANVQKLMKLLTALDVIEQSESKMGTSFFCVIHGVLMDFKFHIELPHDVTKEVEYIPYQVAQLSVEEKGRLPEFLLGSITFSLDVLPKVFWRLSSALQRTK
ncbi:uncharacterized protein EV154DRAFT_517014 [Mucor mucedo]|uniref:uncharacterized protein n=1 Tax=Mucor mucedo TaxID=29922 RepID=UPI00222032CE|nr:uncharacterized protein EV154DRAFT_517014 [Mucor mucedo]KAI7888693.1 hypothetical protein EV154DRAFT_517014 [Mucor mucedo]